MRVMRRKLASIAVALSLLMMVAGRSDGDASKHYQSLLDLLREEPLKFLARIEGALEMRDSARLIQGAG